MGFECQVAAAPACSITEARDERETRRTQVDCLDAVLPGIFGKSWQLCRNCVGRDDSRCPMIESLAVQFADKSGVYQRSIGLVQVLIRVGSPPSNRPLSCAQVDLQTS